MEKYINAAREAVTQYENNNLDLQHILAVLIGPKATPEMCGRLSAYGIRYLSEMTVWELQKEGLSEIEGQRVIAAFNMSQKLAGCKRQEYNVIRSPEDAADLMMEEMRLLQQEHFVCLYLNTKNEVIHKETIFIGSLNSSVVHPREIFKNAFRYAAASMICLHNHPSGDPSPSREDLSVTHRLVECGKMTGIEVLDHVIIGDRKFSSLKEKGYM
ncbi:RadC family protein [Lentibacillus salinarum]|uniref:DNA repair protein RadC n=1 Tax=Lentibacillus salinarum TaxID=446820 RepID=A0ABW3ZYS9_9BACI